MIPVWIGNYLVGFGISVLMIVAIEYTCDRFNIPDLAKIALYGLLIVLCGVVVIALGRNS